MVKAAIELDASLPKTAMAVAFGEQTGNLVQPFWALPIVSIGGVSVREMMGYCLLALLIAFPLFGLSLMLRFQRWRHEAFRRRLQERNFTAQIMARDEEVGRYLDAVDQVFDRLARAVGQGAVEASLRGPVRQQWFHRLT